MKGKLRRGLIRVLAVVAVPALLFGLASASRWVPPEMRTDLRDRVITSLSTGLFRSMTPGPLAPLHAAEIEATDCFACHDSLEQVPDQKCLDCHDEISWNGTPADGVHATFEGRCRDCHADHRDEGLIELDPADFNHARARFSLQGSHADLECRTCHEQPTRNQASLTRMQYQNLSFDGCQDCHEDPHASQFNSQECTDCHSIATWGDRDLRFHHDRDTEFTLDGAHAGLECAECHDRSLLGEPVDSLSAAWLRDLPATSCADCHDDPHEGSLAAKQCSDCHAPAGWTGEALQFDHDRDSRFVLDATHAEVDCAGCHQGNRFDPLPITCADCHEEVARSIEGLLPAANTLGSAPKASPHFGLLECTDCHLPEDRRPAPSVYANRCAGCHTPHYSRLFLDRQRRANELQFQLRDKTQALAPDDAVEQRDKATQWNRHIHHNFSLTEAVLQKLLQETLEKGKQ